MNRTLLIIIILFQFSILKSQVLSKKEAYSFSEKLYEVNILSKKGVDALKKHIDESNFERDKRPNLNDGSISIYSELSVSQILIFLSKAFGSDLYYRSGILEQNKYVNELQKDKGSTPLTQEDYESLNSKLDSLLKDFEGYKIEEKIQDEENFPEESRTISFSMFSFPLTEEFDLISHSRSVMGKTCTRTLNDLLSIGLIDDKVYNEVKSKIESNELTLETYVLSYTTERVIFYEDFKENKLKESSFVKQLSNQGIISKENLRILNNNKENLLNKYDLIKYCEKAKIFHLNNYSVNPENGYKEIFAEIKSIVPQFEYTNFKADIFEKEREWNDDLIEYRASISFSLKGKEYFNEFFYDFKKRNIEEKDTILKINNDFHKGINKYLADLNSKYRLYYANKFERGKGAYGENEFGLILLTEEQFKAWGTSNSDYFLFNQSHDNRFNSNNINEIIATYEKIDLFNHLSEIELNEAKNCVAKSEIDGYQSILLCFPKTIVYFDWETGNLENPYEELTLSFSDASRGAFMPSKIVDKYRDSWDKKTVNYSFEFKGKIYQEALEMKSDWLDPKFMELVEKAIKENNIDGEFYYCLDNGQAAGYIFLTKEQHQYLKENQNGLFPEW